MRIRTMTIVAVMLWASAAHADKSKRIDVIARVAEIPPNLGCCGIIAVRAVLRYEVVEVKTGSYAARDLFVGVSCPELQKVGDVYRLVVEPLRSPSQFIDLFKSRAPRY